MLDLAETADEAMDGNVVWRITQHHSHRTAVHQCLQDRRIEGAAADEAVLAELPDISSFGHGRSRCSLRQPVRLIGLGRLDRLGLLPDQVDLRRRERDRIEVEVDRHQEVEFGLQLGKVPVGKLGKPVVCDLEGPLIFLRQMANLDAGQMADAEAASGFDTRVTGEDDALLVDDDRDQVTELVERTHQGTDQTFVVNAGLAQMRLQAVERLEFDPVDNPVGESIDLGGQLAPMVALGRLRQIAQASEPFPEWGAREASFILYDLLEAEQIRLEGRDRQKQSNCPRPSSPGEVGCFRGRSRPLMLPMANRDCGWDEKSIAFRRPGQ